MLEPQLFHVVEQRSLLVGNIVEDDSEQHVHAEFLLVVDFAQGELEKQQGFLLVDVLLHDQAGSVHRAVGPGVEGDQQPLELLFALFEIGWRPLVHV